MCWFLQLATHGDKRMQEEEKDELLGKRIEVMYYRKNAINPPISIVGRSRVNDHEAIVEVRTSSNRHKKLIAKEIQRARD